VAGYRLDTPWQFAYTTAALQRTGAKITVYQNNTTTKIDLFSDRACVTPAANPIESVNGYFPIRFVATPALHTLLWEDTDGTDRLTANDIAPFQDSAQAGSYNQALDAGLTAFAALTITADKLPYGTGADTFATTTFTAAARTVLDDATTADMLTTLGALALANVATAAHIRANTADKIIDTDGAHAANDYVALVDGETITPDFSTGWNFEVTLGGNRTLAAPTNTKNGQSGTIYFTQDGAGSRTITFNSAWKFPQGADGVLTTTAGAVDALHYKVKSSSFIECGLVKALG